MIQRIQTLWLLFTAIAPLSIMHGGIINFADKTGGKLYVGFQGLYQMNGSEFAIIKESIGLPVSMLAISILSSVTIILFKFRKLQKVLSLIIIALSLCFTVMLAFYSYQAITGYSAYVVFGIRMIIPLVMIFTSVMAYRGILKDENLVKSYDRLR